MAILPLSLARVPNLLTSDIAEQQIEQTQQQLAEVQNELTTGKSLNQPSDNPGSAAIAMQLQKTLDQQQTYLANINSASSQLGEVDTTLGSLSDLLLQAQSIASANVSSDVTPSQRASAAAVVHSLYQQAVTLGNTNFNNAYIFGGDKSTTAPFVQTNVGVQYVGSQNVLGNLDDNNTTLPFQVNGAQVFGALTTQVQGTANLSPSLAAATRIIDVGGATANGVRLGTIQIGNGVSTANVDLSKADTLGDVVNAINKAAVGGITASMGANGINLAGAPGDNITVNDVVGGTTASDLGLLTATGGGAGAAVTGASLQPKVTPLTPLADLKGGAGIDLTDGIIITNGSQSATVNFSGASNVQDLLNKINASGTGVLASINSAGTGINLVNPTQGTSMTIGENGGTTATDLGIRSLGLTTDLSQLNGGKGVNSVAGGDFTITRKDGTSFNVSLTGAVTMQDVINDINTADGGGGVSASLASTGNGLVLTDATGGAGAITVTALNNSTAAKDLGLPASSATNILQGSDVNPVAVDGVFGALLKLQNALQGNDPGGITDSAAEIQNSYNNVVQIRAVNGAEMQELSSRQTSITNQNTATQSFLSQLTDTDFTSAISQFQLLQTSLQASLMTTARTMNLSLLNFLQ